MNILAQKQKNGKTNTDFIGIIDINQFDKGIKKVPW
jgi:hypothetical protein